MFVDEPKAVAHRSLDRRPFLVLTSFVMSVVTATMILRSLFVCDCIQYCPPMRRVQEGTVRVRFSRYDLATSRGALVFEERQEAYDIDNVATIEGWFRYSNLARSLVIPPSPQDRTNARFAGFQWYHGVYVNINSTSTVRRLVLPLWPVLVIMSVLPLRWGRRRQTAGPGFPVTLNLSKRTKNPPS